MPTVTVTVYHDGDPAKDVRVALGAGLLDGVYGPEYTDNDGVAEFDVQDADGGDVYVNGSVVDKWGASSRNEIIVDI